MRQHPSWKKMLLGAEASREEGRLLWPSSSCSLTHSTHCSEGLWLRVKESAHIPRYRSGSRHRSISHPAPESSKKGPERMVTQAQIKSSWSSTKNEKSSHFKRKFITRYLFKIGLFKYGLQSYSQKLGLTKSSAYTNWVKQLLPPQPPHHDRHFLGPGKDPCFRLSLQKPPFQRGLLAFIHFPS